MKKLVCRTCKYTIDYDYDRIYELEKRIEDDGGDLIIDRYLEQVEYSECPNCRESDTLEVR